MAGAGQRCELSCCCGEQGAAHLAGRNPNLQEAAGSRLGLGEGQRLPGQPRSFYGTTGLSQPRPGAKAHRERAGTSCYVQLRQTSRLQAELGYKAYFFFNYTCFFPSKRAWRLLS